jgi:hypothetical protein
MLKRCHEQNPCDRAVAANQLFMLLDTHAGQMLLNASPVFKQTASRKAMELLQTPELHKVPLLNMSAFRNIARLE